MATEVTVVLRFDNLQGEVDDVATSVIEDVIERAMEDQTGVYVFAEVVDIEEDV